MPEEVLASFAVQRLSILDEQGNADESLFPSLSEEAIRRMYRLMVLARIFDERALALQREGRLGTYPPIMGQEATQVGSAMALTSVDWVIPSYREMGAHIALGYPISQLFQYWAGDERGLRTPEGLNIFPICVSVGTHLLHAVGVAMGLRYRREQAAAVTYFGDGATSKGDFHEALNMAGVFQAPVVFLCQNNQWAISVPLKQQTAAKSLAQKAIAYGFEGVQVDGNDIFAVYRATSDALAKARSGGGPTFIECLTYRMADHTTADDAGRYRTEEEVAAWRERDPILRLERYLAKTGLWTETYGREAKADAIAVIDRSVQELENLPLPQAIEMFQHTVATLSRRQQQQLEELR